MATHWCILTCTSANTLALAGSLNEAGFNAWTPAGVEEKRIAPHRTRREVPVALMPGIVLARTEHLMALLALSHSPSLVYRIWDAEKRKMVTRGHPPFRLFKGGNHRPIPDRDLEALRSAERQPKPQRIERTFKVGEKVRTGDGGFAGLVGTVARVSGRMIGVEFEGWPIVPTFASWLLRPVLDDESAINVSDGKSEQATRAKAA